MASPNPSTNEWVPVWNLGIAGGGGGGGIGPHAPTHGIAGSDPVSLDATQIVSGVLVRARLPTQVAYTDVINTFAVNQRITNTGGDFPRLTFINTGGALDQKVWQIITHDGNFNFWALNDPENAVIAGIALQRDGQITASGLAGTPLNASNLALGIAPTARLGSGTANSSTFLRGDSVWAVPPSSGGVIPSGLIAIFDTACPAGWTRVAALDDRFPRGSTAYGGVGGSFNHSHGISGAMGAAGNHTHGIGGNTDPVGDHTHGYSGQTGDGLNATMNAQNGITQVSTGIHSHSYSGTTGGAGGHSHSLNLSTDTQGNHTHSLPGTDSADGTPPYLMVVFCRKD